MPCYKPLTAWRSLARDPDTGKHSIVFNPHKALVEGSSFKVPCGQCIGCKLGKSQVWSMRCRHEAMVYFNNSFVTVTYDDQHVPQDFSVKLLDYQLFLKRVRKAKGRGIRFFGCGEYGNQTLRPHYHFLLFNCDFEDKRFFTERSGNRVYTSPQLGRLWSAGLHEIGEVTSKSAAYVARYSLKKIGGPVADEHYFRVSPVDGQSYRVATEFCTMSRRPGLGTAWLERFGSDVFAGSQVLTGHRAGKVIDRQDFIVDEHGQKRPVPPFYLSKLDELGQQSVKRARKLKAAAPRARANSTPERLRVREEVQAHRMKRLVRGL